MSSLDNAGSFVLRLVPASSAQTGRHLTISPDFVVIESAKELIDIIKRTAVSELSLFPSVFASNETICAALGAERGLMTAIESTMRSPTTTVDENPQLCDETLFNLLSTEIDDLIHSRAPTDGDQFPLDNFLGTGCLPSFAFNASDSRHTLMAPKQQGDDQDHSTQYINPPAICTIVPDAGGILSTEYATKVHEGF